MNRSFKDLMIQYISQYPHWTELVGVLEQVTLDEVVLPTYQLQNLRNISRETDTNIVDDSLALLGHDMFSTLMLNNKELFRKAFYFMNDYYLVTGGPKYPNFIAFILNRKFNVIGLYTEDYVDFYPEPQGSLVQDGGNWYKTSHVNLEIEDRDLTTLFGVTTSDEVKEALTKVFYELAPIEEVVNEIAFIVPARATVQFTATVHVEDTTDLELDGSAVSISISLDPYIIPMEEYRIMAKVVSTALDGVEVTEPVQLLNYSEYLESYDGNTLVFKDVMLEETITLTGLHRDIPFIHAVTIFPLGILPEPSGITIVGSSKIDEYNSGKFTVVGSYNGVSRELYDLTCVEWNVGRPDLATIDSEGNVTITGELFENILDSVSATYVTATGTQFIAYHEVTYLTSVVENTALPKTIEIRGASSLQQGNTDTFVCMYIDTDNNEVQVQPQWSIEAGSAVVDQAGVLTVPILYRDYKSYLKASYQYSEDVILTARHTITCEYPIIEISSMSIVGPDSVYEKDLAGYTLRVVWANGMSSNVAAQWCSVFTSDVSGHGLGDEGGSASVIGSITANGTFTAPSVSANTSALITATIRDEHGTLLTVSKLVTIMNVVKDITYLSIAVASSVREGEKALIKVLSHWNDDTTYHVPDLTPAHFELNVAETTSAEVIEEDGELWLEHKGGETALASLSISVMSPTSTEITESVSVSLITPVEVVDSLVITGPTVIQEGTRTLLKSEIVWESGNIESLLPTWELTFPPESLYDEDDDIIPVKFTNGSYTLRNLASILTGDVETDIDVEYIQAHETLNLMDDFKVITREEELDEYVLRTIVIADWVPEDIEIDIVAIHYKARTASTMLVTNKIEEVHTPVISSRIDGPLEWYANRSQVSYGLLVKHAVKCVSFYETVDWTLDCDDSVAMIDSDGYITPYVNEDHTIVVTAHYDDGITQLTRSLTVKMLKASHIIQGMTIEGDEEVSDNGTYTYEAVIMQMNGTPLSEPYMIWSVDSDSVDAHMGENTGVLTLGEATEDVTITITASHDWYDPAEDSFFPFERVVQTKTINVISEKKMATATMIVPDTLDDSTSSFVIEVSVLRANGDSFIADTSTNANLSMQWNIDFAPEGVELSDNGVLSIAPQITNTPIRVYVNLSEGNTVIRLQKDIVIEALSAPEYLEIVGDVVVRDDSEYEFKAVLHRKNGSNIDVSEECYWSAITTDAFYDDTEIEARTGKLTIGKATEDTELKLKALYRYHGVEIIGTFYCSVRSSLPRFGCAPTLSSIAALPEVHSSDIGGYFALGTELDEDRYGYFAHPASMGLAVFSGLEGTEVEFEDAELWTVEYGQLTEEWVLFKTKQKGFGVAKFTVYYEYE